MGISRAFLFFIGFTVIGLNILQGEGGAASNSINEEVGEGLGAESDGSPYLEELGEAIMTLTGVVLDENRYQLLKRKEIVELLRENSDILKENSRFLSDLRSFAGGETAIRYYLRNFPNHASLLDSAVQTWRKILSKSFENVDLSSIEIYESLMDVKSVSLPQRSIFEEIALKVAITSNVKMETEEYNVFVEAVFIKMNNLLEIMFKSKFERQILKKISALYKQGLFDDICDTLGSIPLEILFKLSANDVKL